LGRERVVRREEEDWRVPVVRRRVADCGFRISDLGLLAGIVKERVSSVTCHVLSSIFKVARGWAVWLRKKAHSYGTFIAQTFEGGNIVGVYDKIKSNALDEEYK
jgi:hypothetical protein